MSIRGVIQKPNKRIQYTYAGRESLTEILKKMIPRQFIPTKRMNFIFGTIFLLVLVIAAFRFPYSSLMSGDVDVTITAGFPLTFVELELQETENSPVKLMGLIIDMLIYIILAYIIDVIISLIIKNPLIQTAEERKKVPTVFKNKKPSIAAKAAVKLAAKTNIK